MPAFARIVVLGAVPGAALSAVHACATERGVGVESLDASTSVAQLAVPLAVLVNTDDPFAVLASLSIRRVPALTDTPVLGLSERRRQEDFLEFFALGGDDLVEVHRMHQLARRVDNLLGTAHAKRAKVLRGQVVLASADERWLALVSVTFERAGFQVTVAGDGESVTRAAMSSMARVVVVGRDMAGDAAFVARLQRSGLAWVVACPSAAMVRAPRHERVRRLPASLPPETLVTATNELLFVENSNRRGSQRLPLATPIAFRVAGSGEDDIGFCHNVSAGGFYVRTLAPPERGQDVWVEMIAPGTDRHVRLMGSVMWKKGYSRADVSAPPGFGVQLASGMGADLDVYRAGYARLLEESTCDPAAFAGQTTL